MRHKKSSLILAVLFSAGACFSTAAEEASILVKTVPVRQERVATTLTCYGVIATDPRGTATVTLPRDARVSRLLVTQGEIVRVGAPLMEVATDPADILNFEQASVSVDYARQELQRVETMFSQRLATQSQLAEARKSLADAEASLREQNRLGNGRKQERLTAPFTATVTAINVKEGDRVPAGTALAQISRQGALRAELGVEPEDSTRVRMGMEVQLKPLFGGNSSLTGVVHEIHGVINPQTRLVDVIVSLAGKETQSFLPGTQVRGIIRLAEQTGWVVPRQSVLRDREGEYIYQVDKGIAHRVTVVSSKAESGLVLIRGKINPRMKVVAVGNYELQDGMAVREGKIR